MANRFRPCHCPLHTHNLIKKDREKKGRKGKGKKRKGNMNRKRGRTSGAKDPKPMRILKQASFMNYLFLA
jgi:hypothetical protein